MRNIICIKFNELINTCTRDLEKLKLNIVKIYLKKFQKILPFLKQTFTTYYIVLLNLLKNLYYYPVLVNLVRFFVHLYKLMMNLIY